MRRMIFLLLAGALIATACGGSSNDASSGNGEASLIAAVLKLQNSPSTMTLSLRSDAASLQALAAAGGGDSMGGTGLSTLLNSSITVSRTGAPGAKDADSQTAVKIGDNSNAIETRMVDKKLYVRADIQGLMDTFGKGGSDLQKLLKDADAQHLDFVRPAVEGKWLYLKGLDKLNKTLASKSGTKLPSADKKKQLSDEFEQRLLSSLTVKTVGEDSTGTHMEASIPARQAYAALQQVMPNAGNSLPPSAMPTPTSIPNKPITVDVWVKDGKVTQIQLDLKRLLALGDKPVPTGVHELAIRVAISDFTGTIEAPAGAVPVDLTALARNYMGEITRGVSASSLGGSNSTLVQSNQPTAMTCSTLKSMSPQDRNRLIDHNRAMQKVLQKECPKVNLKA
jgi:hypothetical protein